MNRLRRILLGSGCATASFGALLAAGLLKPTRVLAAEWQRQAFSANSLGDALKAYAANNSTESREIAIIAAEISENGAQVPIEISSNIPGSQSIAVFVENNPTPLAASLAFSNGALAKVRLQLKMAESSRVRIVVKAENSKTYHASREIRVTLGGCS